MFNKTASIPLHLDPNARTGLGAAVRTGPWSALNPRARRNSLARKQTLFQNASTDDDINPALPVIRNIPKLP